jgi:outer membrane receptor protein involved in Fe transport
MVFAVAKKSTLNSLQEHRMMRVRCNCYLAVTLRRTSVSSAACFAAWFAGILLIPTLPAFAADPEPVTKNATTTDTPEVIRVIGRWEDPLGNVFSASSGVFGQQEIAERPLLRTGELLEFVPGLIMTQHSGSGKSNQMFLRGFNLDHGTDFATWVDGMPVNMRTSGHGQGYTDINFLIEELVERVEFIKGPIDVTIGDFSSAGAARMQTARNLDKGFLKVGGGEYGYLRLVGADTLELDDSALLIGAESRRYDGPWDDINEDLKANKGLVRYTDVTRAGDEWNVALMGYDSRWNAADQIPRRAVRDGLISDLGSLDETVGGDTSRYSLSGSWAREGVDSRWQANAYAISYDLNLLSNFTYFLDDPDNGDQFQQIDDRNIYGGDISYQFTRQVAGQEMNHKIGTDFRYDDISEVALNRTVNGNFASTVRQDRVKQGSAALFYQNEYFWTARLRSVAGVRADYFDFDVDSNLPANSGNDDDTLVSPKLSLIYAWSQATELYLNGAYGMHSNDARGVTISVDPVTGDPVDQVDPLVQSRAAEVGARTFLTDQLNVAVALWYLKLDSELLYIGDAGNTEPAGRSKRYGVEVPIYYQTDYWKFDIEATLTHSEFSDTGDEIPGSLDQVYSAGAYFDYPAGWYGATRLRYFGERPLTEDGNVKSDPTAVVNTMVGYRWDNETWDLRAELLNVFDSSDDDITYYYESRLRVPFDSSGTLEPAGVEDQHFRRVEPRMVRMSLTRYF